MSLTARARPLFVLLTSLFVVPLARGAAPTRAQKIAALPAADRVWLTEFVAPILLPEEEKIFLDLTEAYQREAFTEDFWQRRERENLPLPLGPGYRFRYKERRDVLDQKYDGWQNDAGRIVLRWGEPDEIFKPRCGGEEVFRDVEVWTYSSMELRGQPALRHIFYRIAPSLPRRLWTVHDSNASVFYTNQCRRSFDQLIADCRGSATDRCGPCEDRCRVYNAWTEIVKRQGSPVGALAEIAQLLAYPRVSIEGLERQKTKWATTTDASAKTLHVVGPSGPPSPSPAPPAAPTVRAERAPVPTGTATSPPAPSPTPTPRPTSSPSPAPTPKPPTATPLPPAPAPAPQATSRPATPSPTPTTSRPTRSPSATASATPTASPSPTRTQPPAPTPAPSAAATRGPSPAPTRAPSPAPTPAATRRPTAAAASTPAPASAAEGLRKLSPEQIRERIDTLEPEYKEFLDLARPLMTDEELSRFLQLSGHDKDAFIRDFWKRHS